MGDQLFLCGFALEHHSRGDVFAIDAIRNSEADGFRNRRVRRQNLVDFSRRNFFAAAIDQLLDASGKSQIAFAVQVSLIAGAKPSIGK